MAHNTVCISTTSLNTINGGNFIFSHFCQQLVHSSNSNSQFRLCQSSVLHKLKKTQPFKFPFNSSFSSKAVGPNISEDTDDMFDDLFDKYGKVVISRNDQKPPTAEVDDDAESLSFVVAMAKVANEVKAADIKVLFVKPLVYWTRFFVIATAFSRPQVGAIRTKMADLAEEKFGRVPKGDLKPNSWTLLDFGDVVVHIFLPPQRAFYNLEEFYANATQIELPFEDEKPFGR